MNSGDDTKGREESPRIPALTGRGYPRRARTRRPTSDRASHLKFAESRQTAFSAIKSRATYGDTDQVVLRRPLESPLLRYSQQVLCNSAEGPDPSPSVLAGDAKQVEIQAIVLAVKTTAGDRCHAG
jgi:hypothetical protein